MVYWGVKLLNHNHLSEIWEALKKNIIDKLKEAIDHIKIELTDDGIILQIMDAGIIGLIKESIVKLFDSDEMLFKELTAFIED